MWMVCRGSILGEVGFRRALFIHNVILEVLD